MKDYCFVQNLDDPKLLSVRIMDGEYAGSVFTIHTVRMTKDTLGDTLNTSVKFELAIRKKKLLKRIEPALQADAEEITKHVITTMMDNFHGSDKLSGDVNFD